MAEDACLSLERRIEELERTVRTLTEQKNREELLDLPWAGNLGSWIWNVPSDTVICNDLKILNLGYAKQEIPDRIGHAFFTDLLHPDDHGPVMDQMRRHLAGTDAVYEASYRIRHKDGSWRWYYDRGKITQRDAAGKPLQLVGIVFDITKQKLMEQQLALQNELLQKLVDHDELTKVLSRAALFRFLRSTHDRCVQEDRSFALLMLDIDHFKHINDSYGHQVGDEVLVQLARLVGSRVRGADAFGRYGGEEFMMVLDGLGMQEAMQVAERIRITVADHAFTGGIRLTISGGLALFQGQGIDELVTLADNRLYEAKRSGRNKIIGPR
ncbi:MAG: sensor domain-containing diguanylate cyclase [Sphaerochaetaceae bacterium]|nr:sensor domain-containing diguanylate cyclase [Sphaerochaetaceae bacterium]